MDRNIYNFALCIALVFASCSLEGDIELLRPRPVPVSVRGPVLSAPGVPIVLSGDGMITVRWAAVEEALSYEVYIGTNEQPPALPDTVVYSTAAVFDNLVNKTVYYVWVKAKDARRTSAFSPRARGIPWPANEKPAAPGELTIIPGINQLTAIWEECGGASSYEVYISITPAAPSTPEVVTDKANAVIRELDNDVIYYLWVRAVNNAGESDYSPRAVGTPRVPTVAPASPAMPVLTAGSRELAVSWQAVELAASYEVWVGTSGNSAQAQKFGSDVIDTETVITGLTNEVTYYVWIKAKNIIGASGFSPPANAKPSAFAAIPETPEMPVVSPGSRELNVSWPPAEGALSYELWIGETDNPAGAEKHGADVSGTSVTLNNLVNNTTYYIWVRAKNNAGESGFSPMSSGTPSVFAAVPPAPQAAPTVTAGSGQLTLSWPPAEGALSYEVWMAATPNPATAAKRGDDVTGLSAVVAGLVNGTTYYVWIKAKNSIGTGGFGPAASGTPSAFSVAPGSPPAPSVGIGSGQITVTWAAVEGTTAYEIWLGTASDSASAAKNGADESASLSRTITGLTNGTTYYVWIKAKNSIGTSGFSPAASGKPIANAAAPTLTAANGQLSAVWAAIAGADQYEVFYGTGINPPQTPAQTVNATTAAITALVNGTSYNVWVRGRNSTGTGAMSAAASARPVGNMGAVTLVSGNNQLTANWSAVAGADQYEVYFDTTNVIPASPAQTVNAPATTATITGLTNGTTYYVFVIPKNTHGAGAVSTAASGTPLATPGNLTLNAANQQITVSWAAVPGAASYEVYQSTTATIPASPAGTAANNEREFTDLSNGTTYYFWVKAVNANGTSGASPAASGKPIGNMGAVTLTPGNDQLSLSWAAVAGADQYEVYFDTTNAIPASPAQTVNAPVAAATITGLTNGTTYYVWVKPKNANGVGSTSAAASGVPMAAPGNLTISVANQQVTVSWASVPGAAGYEIYQSTGTTIPASPSFTTAESSRTITGLTNGTTYNYWVKAVNASGTSAASPRASGKPIGNMGAVTVSVGGSGQLVLTWAAVVGADEYEVYHSATNTMPGTPSQTVTTTTATVSSLTNGTTYYVWVKPKNANGTGGTSAVVNGKPLGTPGALTVTPDYKVLVVTWTAVPGADEYEVYYGTGTTPTTLATTATGTTATITGLTGGITYYVRLRAKNSTGVSDYGPNTSGVPSSIRSPGLYRGDDKIGTQNLSASVSYISANSVTGDNFFIVLGADESVSPMTLNFSGKTVAITLLGYGSERTLTLNANGSMFTIPSYNNSGVTLTIDKNITLVGNNANTASLVSVSAGELIINDGAKINGNTGGGIQVPGDGIVTMNGGTITGNTNNYGGGIYVGGTFTMNDGTISGNTATNGGGGVCVTGTFIMNGGTISNNTGTGVWDLSNANSIIIMNGGTISGNTGSGISVERGTFTMHGGTISGHTNGGVKVGTTVYDGTFKKMPPTGGGPNSGIIYGSEAVGNDANGIPLRNTVSSGNGHVVLAFRFPSQYRNTTANQTDHIDTTTGRGLSADGNPPFGQ